MKVEQALARYSSSYFPKQGARTLFENTVDEKELDRLARNGEIVHLEPSNSDEVSDYSKKVVQCQLPQLQEQFNRLLGELPLMGFVDRYDPHGLVVRVFKAVTF